MEEGESLMTLICGGVQQHNIFQTICKWMVDDEAEWPQENEILFHLLKESAKKEIVPEDNMVAKRKLKILNKAIVIILQGNNGKSNSCCRTLPS